jgi:hypothetical protein
MPASNSKNLGVPSSTGATPGVHCNHPMSSQEPRKVLRTRDIMLKITKRVSMLYENQTKAKLM